MLTFCHLRFEAVRPLPNGYPTELETIGDHIRRRRMDLGLFQREVARRIGVTTDTVCLWEKTGSTPMIQHMPKIIRFLGYVPIKRPMTVPNQLSAYRMTQGLTQEQAARKCGVDPSTWGTWEDGKKFPGSRRTKSAVGRILQALDSKMWNAKKDCD